MVTATTEVRADVRTARLRARLLTERTAHVALVKENDATAVALQGNTDVDSNLEREVAEVAAARARAAVDDIDAALARLGDGTYGTCDTCGRPIGEERLAAIPHARTCVACPGVRARLPGSRRTRH